LIDAAPLLFDSVGSDYVITLPTADLKCHWWSITLYGYDDLLIPNNEYIYSVNSFQVARKPELAGKQVRVVCSPKKPAEIDASLKDCLWIPLPSLKDSNRLLDPKTFTLTHKIASWFVPKKHPHLVLRGIVAAHLNLRWFTINALWCAFSVQTY
jgi:hypothetical protein